MIIVASFISVTLLLVSLHSCMTYGLDMDVKCVVYEGSDEINGNNADVRVLVLGLKVNNTYSIVVKPDHNPPVKTLSKTDKEGILWTIVNVPNGEKSILFKVDVYNGTSNDMNMVASGDDDAPCHKIFLQKKK